MIKGPLVVSSPGRIAGGCGMTQVKLGPRNSGGTISGHCTDREVTKPNLFRAVKRTLEVNAISKNVLQRREVAQEETDGVEDRLHGVAGDILPAQERAQRFEQGQVDEVASSHNVVEPPEFILS